MVLKSTAIGGGRWPKEGKRLDLKVDQGLTAQSGGGEKAPRKTKRKKKGGFQAPVDSSSGFGEDME